MKKEKVQVPCRVINLIGIVDENMLLSLETALRPIIEYDYEILVNNARMLEKYQQPIEPIRINLTSPGGSVDIGNAIKDLFSECYAPIHIHATGVCASMGVMILLEGDIRTAGRNTTFMIHGSSSGYGRSYLEEAVGYYEFVRGKDLESNEWIKTRCNIPDDVLEKSLNVAKYFDYKQALEWGLLTEDIYADKDEDEVEAEADDEALDVEASEESYEEEAKELLIVMHDTAEPNPGESELPTEAKENFEEIVTDAIDSTKCKSLKYLLRKEVKNKCLDV